MHSFIQSLSHSELVNIGIAAIYTFIIGFTSLFGYLAYSLWDEYYQTKHSSVSASTSEKHSHTYGIRETAVTIQYDDLGAEEEAFLRHIRALHAALNQNELLDILEEFAIYLKSINHINFVDIQELRFIVRNADKFSKAYVQYAEQWLHVAKTYWMVKPCDEMVLLPGFNSNSHPPSRKTSLGGESVSAVESPESHTSTH